MKHVKFQEGDIHKLIKKASKVTKERKNETKFDISVILENGSVYNDLSADLFADQNKEDPNVMITQTLTYLDTSRSNFNIPGDIVKTT